MMYSRLSPAILLAVALGSAAGGMMRHGVSAFGLAGGEAALPWPTLLVNTLGSYLVGLLLAVIGPYGHIRVPAAIQAGLIAGVCGGLTTFSAFSIEMVLLPGRHGPAWTLAWVVVSMLVWIAAVAGGHATGRRIGRARAVSTDS